MDANLIPFGKHKGEPVEVLLADADYRDWLMAQPWFRDRYPVVYQTIINYGGEPADTPEHNEMQASFLDDERCLRLGAVISPKTVSQDGSGVWRLRTDWWDAGRWVPSDEPAMVKHRRFEFSGWDVFYRIAGWMTIMVELKPDLGDDFPSVLRQVLRYGGDGDRCVIARRHQFTSVKWEQVVTIFRESGVTLLHESDLIAEEEP